MSKRNLWVGMHPDYDVPHWFIFELDQPTDYARDNLSMALLIPNTRHPHTNNIDLIFCLPAAYAKWNKWKALSDQHKKSAQGIALMDRVENGKVQTIIMLPETLQSDEDVLTAVAYLRMIENVTCRVYVVRSTFQTITDAQRMNAVIGADPDTIIDVPEPADEKDSNDG